MVRDGAGRLVQAIDIDENQSHYWTRQVNGKRVSLGIEGCEDGEYPNLETKGQIVYLSDQSLRTYSIAGNKPTWVDLHGTDNIPEREHGDFVGVLWGYTDTSVWSCSGLMVGHRYFLTN